VPGCLALAQCSLIGVRVPRQSRSMRAQQTPLLREYRVERLLVPFRGRTFVTRAARLGHRAGGSPRDVPLLPGHRSIQTTERFIDGDTDAQRELVGLI
jgi:hypothetical protein